MITSHVLYEALKRIGVFTDADDDGSVVGFTIQAKVGQSLRLHVEREVEGSFVSGFVPTIVETISRFECVEE